MANGLVICCEYDGAVAGLAGNRCSMVKLYVLILVEQEK
jgi:hypothetical protein